MASTNRLLAGIIVRLCALQTTRRDYPIETLRGLGLSSREIAEAMGTTEASVNVTQSRGRRKKATDGNQAALEPAQAPSASEAP